MVLVCPLVVLVCRLVVIVCSFVCPFLVRVCPFVVSVCPLVGLLVLSLGLFITDHEKITISNKFLKQKKKINLKKHEKFGEINVLIFSEELKDPSSQTYILKKSVITENSGKYIAKEILKAKQGISPDIISDLFFFKQKPYNFRHSSGCSRTMPPDENCLPNNCPRG